MTNITYLVSRTSMCLSKESPCEEAFQQPIIREYDDDGYPTTDRKPKNCWCVKFNSIEELNNFINKYGDIIIMKSSWINSNYPEIEIYDDCRE